MTGEFATSKAGHDKEACYVIVKEEGDFVYLSDGRLKSVCAPKKKSKKHIQIIHRSIPEEMVARLLEPQKAKGGQVRDEEIRYEIQQYKKEVKGV